MNYNSHFFIAILVSISFFKCTNHRVPEYHYKNPNYNLVHLNTTKDTIKFAIDSFLTRDISSFNYFANGEDEFISFYDKRTHFLSIYSFSDQKFVKRINIKNCLPGIKVIKPTAYLINFDSILVINNRSTLYLIDSSLKIKDSIVLQVDPYPVFASFTNRAQPIVRDQILYIPAAPYLDVSENNNVRKWKNLYKLDIKNNKVSTLYGLPDIYLQNRFSFFFFNSSYCQNEKNRFVFSFPADTNIYETDLQKYHYAYYGKSLNQTGIISMPKTDKRQPTQKSFLLEDSYGAIYFDPYTNRYLRAASFKLNDQDYRERRWIKKQSMIIFDDQFRIVGESKLDRDISLSSLFFTKRGKIYGRTKTESNKSIYFVSLEYSTGNADQVSTNIR